MYSIISCCLEIKKDKLESCLFVQNIWNDKKIGTTGFNMFI